MKGTGTRYSGRSGWPAVPTVSGRRPPGVHVCALGSWLRENAGIEFANGNFVSTSINLKNKSAGDGCRDKTIEKTILRAFRARTFSRSQGQKAKFRGYQRTSALAPKSGHPSLMARAVSW
jgi:hypothetical protein